MKAIIRTRSGPPEVLELRDVDKPVPGDGEVLIRVRAATVTSGDVVLRAMPDLVLLAMSLFMGLHKKVIPGSELAGEIEAAGPAVARFRPGDAVFGATGLSGVGSYAEYVCLPEDAALAPMPANLSFEEAAAVPVGGFTALYYLRQADIQPGQRVLINGASGSVGSYAVQLARHYGADVTGVSSATNIELVRSLGANHVIDYAAEDFTTAGATYDVIFDAVGKSSREAAQPALAPGGVFLTVRKGLARGSREGLSALKKLVEDGALRPVIDRRYPLAQAAEAHRYVETGRKRGNVVLVVDGG